MLRRCKVRQGSELEVKAVPLPTRTRKKTHCCSSVSAPPINAQILDLSSTRFLHSDPSSPGFHVDDSIARMPFWLSLLEGRGIDSSCSSFSVSEDDSGNREARGGRWKTSCCCLSTKG